MSPLTGGRAWVTGDPYLIDTCDVMRQLDVGSEDGTPMQAWTAVASGVGCRFDSISAKRYDIERRYTLNFSSQDNAICFMPPTTNIRSGDKLVFTSGPQVGQQANVLEVERAYGGFGVHHLEVQCSMMAGDI